MRLSVSSSEIDETWVSLARGLGDRGNGIDLNQGAPRQILRLEGVARGQGDRLARGHPFRVDLVHPFEVSDIGKHQRHDDNVFLVALGRRQNRIEIREHPLGLGIETVCERSSGRIASGLSAHINQVLTADRLGLVA